MLKLLQAAQTRHGDDGIAGLPLGTACAQSASAASGIPWLFQAQNRRVRAPPSLFDSVCKYMNMLSVYEII